MAGRTERTPLSRERLLTAAVTLADTHGLKAVTMRRLAADLSIEAMSLYHHVPGKDGLLDGLIETVVAEIEAAIGRPAGGAVGGDWRATVRRRCLTARVVMLRHPWAPGLISSRSAIPPGVYVQYEAVLAALVGGGFDYRLAHRALHALGSMVLGFVSEPFSPAAADSGDADPSPEQMAEMAAYMPHLAAMVTAELHAADGRTLGWCDSQTEFEFTLDLLLDGLGHRLRHSA